ncbi:MAG TPA: CoA ester lyase [Burkholderiales bacterium]|nr:CoA ester lyase [Burkholderiales bacterium]
MKPDLPVWRSLMYVPVNVEKYVEKAHTRGADCIQLDLEDSVPAAQKDAARRLVPAAAARVRRGGADVVVRINSPFEVSKKDLPFCISEQVDGIALTKTESAEHVRRIDDFISDLEARGGLPPGRIRLIAMIETPAAFFRMPAIAAASARLAAMNIGGEDFALETGMEPTEETLLMPKQQMVFAARAAGILPLGFIASVAAFGDWEAFGRMVRRSRRFGFMGAGCIHPGQVPIVNREYSPSAEEAAYARRVLEENAKAEAAGRASFAIDGKMIDVPVVERARRLLARLAAIEAREAKKRAAAV